jgi:drug/metabolite transporter (DMT)-like permease
MLAGGCLLVLVAAITGDISRFRPEAVTTNSLVALGYLVVFGSLVAYTSYVWLLQVSTPSRVSTYAYVNPVVAVALGWLILGEKLTNEMIIATPLILLAVILITTSPTRQVEAAEEPEIVPAVTQQAPVGAEK